MSDIIGNDEIARIAAILEKNHKLLDDLSPKATLDSIGLKGYMVVSTGTFQDQTYTKAIAIKDNEDNIYIHYYGTGNGNWKYNAAAYGEPPSDTQEWAADHFDKMYKDYREDGEHVPLYQLPSNIYPVFLSEFPPQPSYPHVTKPRVLIINP